MQYGNAVASPVRLSCRPDWLEQIMQTTASRRKSIWWVRIGVGAGAGLALGWLMAGCPANVKAETVPPPVPGGDYGISVAPTSGPAAGGTMITFTSVHGGFDARTSVLFGDQSATDVRVYNENVMTAVAPAGVPGAVDLRLHAPVDSKLQVMINEQGAGSVKLYESQPIVIDAGEFTYYVVPPDSGTDADGDGLSDAQERAGWEVWIDSFALATDGTTHFNTLRYNVTSDPTNADTDGDGLPDNVEFLIKSDPTRKDSDGDGLWDGEEWDQWLTSPTNVDTDGDTRGDPDHPLAPNQALFDGAEMYDLAVLQFPPGDPQRVIKPRATSPTLADTDGDGVSDFDEFDSTVRNGVNADLPLLNYELVGDVDVALKVEYEESAGQTHEYGTTLTESRSETVASSFSNTIGWSLQVMVGIENETSIGLFASENIKEKLEITAGVHGEYTWENSQESSHESSKELSKVETDEREFTQTAADGEIRTAILLTNGGNTTFTVSGLGVLVSKNEKKKPLGDISAPKRLTIATLTPVFDSITLAPGETAGPFELAATGVNATAIKELLAAPDTLMLGTANMEFTDANGLNFDYVRQFTAAQTAQVVIDFGDGEVRQYTVATNVDRNPDSTYRGITLGRVLEENLGIPSGDPRTGYTTMVNPDAGRHEQVLQSLLNHVYEGPDNQPAKYWNVIASEGVRTNVDFGSIVLHAGDFIHLMFQRDDDGDGLSNNLERAAGTDINPYSLDDADGDGLTDLDEVVKGWVAFAAPSDTGVQWANELVSASSSRAGHPATAALVLPPATAPDTVEYGSAATAWSPNPQNGSLQWIDVRVPTPVYASGVTIRETWGNGFVYQIDAADADQGGVLRTVWRGTDPSLPGAAQNFLATFPTTEFHTRRVRIYVDTNANPDTWEEIDAIAIHGYTDTRVHRVLSDPRSVDSDDDGLADAQERAGATADPALFVSSDPLDPDTDGDGLLDGVDPFPTIAAKTKYVKAGAVAGGNGNDWLHAYQTIQQALAAVATGQSTPTNPNDDVSQVWVASGVYEPASRLAPIALVNKVAIYGGFAGVETKLGQRNVNPFANGCIITGDLSGDDTGVSRVDFLDTPGTSIENCPAVVTAGASIDSTAVLDGFMITGAYSLSTDTNNSKGGLYVLGSPTIQNCLFTGNGSRFKGAGVFVDSAGGQAPCKAVFRKCVFAGNVANAGGGVAIANPLSGGAIVFEDCEFSQNETRPLPNWIPPAPPPDTFTPQGGAAYVFGSASLRVDFNRCAFTGNAAWAQGGALYSSGGANQYTRLDSCRFYGNRTTCPTNSNSSGSHGAGGAVLLGGYSSVSNSVFWNNKATFGGGGIAVSGGGRNASITNCTLAYNRVENANAIGGGITVFSTGGGAAFIENTIAWQNYYGLGAIPEADADTNAPTEQQQIYVASGASAIVRNCCLNAGSTPPPFFVGNGGNFAADPSFGGLANGDLSIKDDSPCVDRGNSYVDLDPLLPGLQFLPAFDVAGKPRITDGNGDGIIAVDLGAYEAPAPVPAPESAH